MGVLGGREGVKLSFEISSKTTMPPCLLIKDSEYNNFEIETRSEQKETLYRVPQG